MLNRQKAARTVSASKWKTLGRGGLDRIAKRRYTRDLFDGIVKSMPESEELVNDLKNLCQTKSTVDDFHITEDERIVTLLRCFNNFFNKKFDDDRLFKALNYVLAKDRMKVIASWLNQKKADNIYILGRFILQISNFMESAPPLSSHQLKTIENLFKLIFHNSQNILDENLILIFSFLARKGFFRSMIGFLMKTFDKVDNIESILLNPTQNSDMLVWISFIQFPLSFAVNWRTKVELWLKKEIEKREIYGSNGSLDEDYATSSIMNQSIISVSSEFSPEDHSSRQTRIFLKRLTSSWFNSINFPDTFFQYFPTVQFIMSANAILANTVPIYLLILALVEPTKFRRKYSVDSLIGLNKNLVVLYKLNAVPSLGILHLFARNICVSQNLKYWEDVKQEEAYGIIMFFYIIIHSLKESGNLCPSLNYPQQSKSNTTQIININEYLYNDSITALSSSICNLFEVAFYGPLDPDVVLPMAYLLQYLKHDLPIAANEYYRCTLMLSEKTGFLRYLWSLVTQSTTTVQSDSNSSTSRRCSISNHYNLDCSDNIIMKMLSDGRTVGYNDMTQFLQILSTLLQCLIFHMSTLYSNECHYNPQQNQTQSGHYRRKTPTHNSFSNASNNSNNQLNPNNSKVFLWSEIYAMASELIILSNGLVDLLYDNQQSLVMPTQNSNEKSINQYTTKSIGLLSSVIDLIQIFFIHFHKLNVNDLSLPDIGRNNCSTNNNNNNNTGNNNLSYLVENDKSIDELIMILELVVKDNYHLCQFTVEKINFRTAFILRQFPSYFPIIDRVKILQKLFNRLLSTRNKLAQIKSKSIAPSASDDDESISINLQISLFQTVSSQIPHIENLKPTKIVNFNDTKIEVKDLIYQALHDGLDSSKNHLFICEAEQLCYPNPYVDTFFPDSSDYYRYLGKLFALNLLYGNKIKRKFSLFFLEKLVLFRDNLFNINDLASVDMEVSKNLMLLSKAEDGLECFNFKFVLTQNSFGKTYRHEMVSNGDTIPVTNDNKMEYINRVVEFILDKQIRDQTESFRLGIDDIFPIGVLSIVQSNELQNIITPN